MSATGASGIGELLRAKGKLGYVQVNQRDLIDKMLARYCSDFVIVREFTQNADDAGATKVSLEFTTRATAGRDATACPVTDLCIRNNGRAFTEDDWVRVTRIAEGNPDQDSVGMFGVGFYAAFSLTENPVVMSGTSALGFFWEGIQLATSFYDKHQAHNHDFPTAVAMSAKAHKVEPWDFLALRAYLVKAIAFTKSVSTIRVLFNGDVVCTISKALAQVPRAPKHQHQSHHLVSANKYLTTTSVNHTIMTVTITFLDISPSKSDAATKKRKTAHGTGDALLRTQTSVTPPQLVTHTAQFEHIEALAKSSLPPDFMERAHRVIKKNLPSLSRFQLLFPHNLTELRSLQLADSPLQHLAPVSVTDLSPTGQVFIGLATHQTTGSGFHVHAQFIPTIERENIDFQDPTIGAWNRELLDIVGQISRLAYDSRAAALSGHCSKKTAASTAPSASSHKRKNSADPEAECRAVVAPCARPESLDLSPANADICCVLAGAALAESVPSAVVGKEIAAGFLRASLELMLLPTIDSALSSGKAKQKQGARLATTNSAAPGMDSSAASWTFREAPAVLLPNNGMEEFVCDHLSVVPTLLSTTYKGLFERLAAAGLKRLTLQDLAKVLEAETLSEPRAAKLIRWFCDNPAVFSEASAASRKSKSALYALRWLSSDSIAEGEEEEAEMEEVRLKDMHFFMRTSVARATAQLPTMPSVLPTRISAMLSESQLTRALGLKEVPLMKWIEFVVKKTKIGTPSIATCFFLQLSRRFGELKGGDRQKVKGLLETLRCVPTSDKKQPMKIPADAYLPSASLAAGGDSDLPFVAMPVVVDVIDVPESAHNRAAHMSAALKSRTLDLESEHEEDQTQSGENSGNECEDGDDGATAGGVSTSLLRFLGVRSSPSMQRLLRGAGSTKSAQALVQALFAQGPLSGSDREEVMQAAIFPGYVRTLASATAAPPKRSLYAPSALHFSGMEDNFGPMVNVPFLDFPGIKEGSPEYALLKDLGVRAAPPQDIMLSLCAAATSLDPFAFFLSHFRQHYAKAWKNPGEIKDCFLPTRSVDMPAVCHHKDLKGVDAAAQRAKIFINPARCVISENPLTPSLCTCAIELLETHAVNPLELGVRTNVEAATAVAHLVTSPPTPDAARSTFEFMSQLPFTANDVKKLRDIAFIPTIKGHMKPDEVLLASDADFATSLAAPLLPSKGKGRSKKVASATSVASAASAASDLVAPTAKTSLSGASKRKARVQEVIVLDDDGEIDTTFVVPHESKASSATDSAAEKSSAHLGSGHAASSIEVDDPFAANSVGLSHPKLLAEALRQLLVCVDFGPLANQFLATCQVQTKPTPDKLAVLMLNKNGSVLDKPHGERMYLSLLLYIGEILPSIGKPVLARLKSEPWLLAYRRTRESAKKEAGKTGPAARASSLVAKASTLKGVQAGPNHPLGLVSSLFGDAVVAAPNSVFLIDDARLERLLCPLEIPQIEDSEESAQRLQRLYEQMGCQWLGSAATVESEPVGELQETSLSRRLEDTIRERSGLLFLTNRGTRRPGISERAERRLKELVVREVRSIVQTITFQGKQFKDSLAPPCCMASQGRQANVLCVVRSATSMQGIDMYFVSRELCKILFTDPNISNGAIHEMKENLQEDLKVLQERGVPVDQLVARSKGKQPFSLHQQNHHQKQQQHHAAELEDGDDADVFEGQHGHTSGAERMPHFASTNPKKSEALLRGRHIDKDRIVTHYNEFLSTTHECTINDDMDLRKEPRLYCGFPLYIDARIEAERRPAILAHAPLFGVLLESLCSKVFKGQLRSSVHLFYDVDSAKIAYNSDGSIFCNLRYFMQAHVPKFSSATKAELAAETESYAEFVLRSEGERKARNEWFVTLCHEAAHNTSSVHNLEHESAMEQLIADYLPYL